MKETSQNNKFNIGEIVVAKLNRKIRLIIADYKDRIYYCKTIKEPYLDEQVYFEIEIESTNDQIFKLKKTDNILKLFGIVK